MSHHDWKPTARIQILEHRARLLWSLREFFHNQGILEIQTPVLSQDTVIDRHIDPLHLEGEQFGLPELSDRTFYLQTSPEFCMKRLVAGGLNAIYQVASVFRGGERGMLHNPEFTMVEWYRTGDDLEAGIDLLSRLIRHMLGSKCVESYTYQEAFLKHVKCDPLSSSPALLAEVAVGMNLAVDREWSSDRDDWLNLIFAECVQPHLGHQYPAIVTHFPASQSALARISPHDSRTAERYELFVRGMELANGYHELLDGHELETRNRRVLQQRDADGKAPLPMQSRMQSAMHSGLPNCSGCALGFDRLVMAATHSNRIDEVIPFPIERA